MERKSFESERDVFSACKTGLNVHVISHMQRQVKVTVAGSTEKCAN